MPALAHRVSLKLIAEIGFVHNGLLASLFREEGVYKSKGHSDR
jgi:hypothetical protein